MPTIQEELWRHTTSTLNDAILSHWLITDTDKCISLLPRSATKSAKWNNGLSALESKLMTPMLSITKPPTHLVMLPSEYMEICLEITDLFGIKCFSTFDSMDLGCNYLMVAWSCGRRVVEFEDLSDLIEFCALYPSYVQTG